jgi:spore maturation protein CgeB
MVVGAQYPKTIAWPDNVQRREHLAPDRHPQFYASQRFTLNVTRADMRAAGHSPSVRLFEAAACATPIISDDWPGLAEIFRPNEEIVIVRDSAQVIECLRCMSDTERRRLANNARDRTIEEHSGARRAEQLEQYIGQAKLRRAEHGKDTGARLAVRAAG